MGLPFDKVFTSPIYTFLIGPEKVEFTLHAAAVAHMSAPLGAMLNNGMVETREQCAWLKDADRDTFARFSRFVYTGDYEEAAPDIILDESMIGKDVRPCIEPNPDTSLDRSMNEHDPPPCDEPAIPSMEPTDGFNDSPWGSTTKSYRKKKWNKGKKGAKIATDLTMLWEPFSGKKYDVVTPALFVPSRPNKESSEDYTPVFLCHARLYVFADEYNIAPLRNLSLHKLHDSLCKYRIYQGRIGHIVELVRFAYGHTIDSDKEPLRALVAQYVASKVETLADDVQFQDLLREPGAAAKDLVRLMARRLCPF